MMKILSRTIFAASVFVAILSLFMDSALLRIILPSLAGIYLFLGWLFLDPGGSRKFDVGIFAYGYIFSMAIGDLYLLMKGSSVAKETAIGTLLIILVVILLEFYSKKKRWRERLELIIYSGIFLFLILISIIIH